ncbi:ClpXP protease specificity-enhancing factor [Methylomonas sp. SURF-1]|uniref:ClpXP protease specificity-enhancing factor n=1 Tax=Methylomonas aurea TaxID=2952224 RepID=A0ABT1UFV2_9GAMM|nr:ClpXP protease specificity-enhancing factor [Methylomonas sp. SURF-1]MCQ8180911.1 ClpXP protease specificity-enhancing factor [Methylomonas sp. SURF-1]
MTPLKPYLIRSIYEWIVDNSLTPHLLVNAEYPGVVLPTDFVEDGRIVLNIRPEAIQGLNLGNDEIQFNARFAGKAMRIVAPCKAVLAIYAKENGKGMIFDPDETDDETPPAPPEPKPPQKPQLRVVK